MDCLKGYIGLRIEPDDVCPSGLFINDLNGISLQMLDKIAGEEEGNFFNIWQKIENRALLKFERALQARILKNYSILDDVVAACVVCNNKAKLMVAWWYYLGIEVMIERTSSDRINYYTTVDVDTAESLKKQYQIEYDEAFDLATSCLDVGACLQPVRHVHPNRTYTVRPSRF